MFSDPIEQSDNSGSMHRPGFATDGITNSTVGIYGTHVFVVNVSTGAVLFRTCKDKIIQNVQTQVTRLHTYRSVSSSTIESLPASFQQVGKNGQLIDAWSASLVGFDFDYADLVSDFTNAQIPGVASYTYDEFDSARTPYLDLTSIFGQETSTLTVGPLATRASDTINRSQRPGVRAQFAGRRYWQRKRFFMSGTYLPRRATAGVMPLGIVLVKVKLEVRATATTILSANSYGFFLHDLQQNTTTTLVPVTANFHGSQCAISSVTH